ncbi:hypothetical protein SAMN04487949_2560 [Halogranum gelatinilyticum]|uniref:Uncharacterized protein n=1 Tax=Halogranum gelatinilyticum TaxID=660521 RepID=A0A1G9VYZ3_9EURY|nr:hypothetical protein [Halogranum gelatinilyticum]SDM77474.1 hypothetical protein SAMN04487949_2560 [Halogranum gelatinilyticum]
MTISFAERDASTGLTVSDVAERRQYALETPASVTPTPADPDRFWFPVDEAVSIRTATLTLPSVVATYVRTADGEMLREIEHFDSQTFQPARYSVELCAPIKLYVQVDGGLSVETHADHMTLSFDADADVVVGARSHHKHPEATITTTADPRDQMQALSALSSSLKTTTCERSYPTLRGHPPTVELGDELEIPDELSTPETGVRIEIPPTRRYLYPVVPLAYYLGAAIEPGPTPRIVTETGFEHSLDTPRGFEHEVERVLKQTFFFDCLTRTEGYYKVALHEREAVEDLVDLDFTSLYDRSLAEQLEAYLDIPYAVVEDHVPEWKLTTHVAPDPENVELLPFLVNDLAVVRLPQGQQVSASEAQMAALSDFTRDEFVRSAAESPSESDAPSLVQPEAADSLEQAWAGEDAPIGASKASVQAFRNRLDRTASDGDIDITVVCNDDAMDEEGDLAEEIYGSRSDLPFDVTIYRDLSTVALQAVIETDSDFLHYIGHIDDEGFDCADGKLDVADLDTVGVDAFFLNACRSYDQGMALIERGAIGGVVTLSDVINSGAVRVGKTMVRLLNQGFPLRAALNIAKDESIVGGQYIVVGDGNVDVVQSDSRTPGLLKIESNGDVYEVSSKLFPTNSHGMGTMAITPFGDEKKQHLAAGEIDVRVATAEEISDVVAMENIPILFDGRLRWSQNFSIIDE